MASALASNAQSRCAGRPLARAAANSTLRPRDPRESRVRRAGGDGRGADEPALDHVALPVNVTDEPAFAESPAARQDRRAFVWRCFREHERPCPPDRGMPGRIGTLRPEILLPVGSAGRLPVEHERTRMLVLSFRQRSRRVCLTARIQRTSEVGKTRRALRRAFVLLACGTMTSQI